MIELGKKYRTRDGREVRIYAVDGGGEYTIHGALLNSCNEWEQAEWTRDGSYVFDGGGSHHFDLIEVRPEVTVRYHVYLNESGVLITLNYSVAPPAAWRKIGTIDITHDGEKLVKVEVVK